MKKLLLALALCSSAALVTVRAQDDSGEKDKTFHVTVWVTGVSEPIEIDGVVSFKHEKDGFSTRSAGGGRSWIAPDKIVAWTAEPQAVHKKAQEEKAPR